MVKIQPLDCSFLVEIPFMPSMPAWQYLREVIAPAVNGLIDETKGCMLGYLVCVQQFNLEYDNDFFVFDRAHRHWRMEHVIPFPDDDEVLICILPGSNDEIYWGNAVEQDPECSICLSSSPDFLLESCNHCFHVRCLTQCRQRTCPMCRKPFTELDEALLLMQAPPHDDVSPRPKRRRL